MNQQDSFRIKVPAAALTAIRVAQELSEPGEPNNEYIRGQAELICDLFHLPMDECRDEIIAEIGKGPVWQRELLRDRVTRSA